MRNTLMTGLTVSTIESVKRCSPIARKSLLGHSNALSAAEAFCCV